MKLIARFIAVFVAGTLLLLAAHGYLAHQHESAALETDAQQDASALGQSMKELVEKMWLTQGRQQAMQLIEEIDRQGHRIGVRWLWLDTPTDGPTSHERILAIREQHEVSFAEMDGSGRRRCLTYVHVAVQGQPDGAVEVSSPVATSADSAYDALTRLFAFGGAAVLLGGVFTVVLGDWYVSRPLKRLIEKTRRIGDGDLSGPLGLNRHDELGELGEAIDAMCSQLQDAQERIQHENSARIAALEQLRHADRLRTVGRLASGIAHELGTPLNVVSGRASLIGSGRLSDEDVKQSATAIKAESDRMTAIVRQLLDFARRNPPQKATAGLRELVTQTFEMLRPLAARRKITLEVDEGSEILARVDVGQMQQVLSNLLVNAMQSVSDGGPVRVAVGQGTGTPPEGSDAGAGEYARIEVRDLGKGIRDEDIPHLFEPFFTTKDVGEGTGLGLSIAYGIVREHDGWIEVTSEVGQGSCFTVCLPAEDDSCVVES